MVPDLPILTLKHTRLKITCTIPATGLIDFLREQGQLLIACVFKSPLHPIGQLWISSIMEGGSDPRGYGPNAFPQANQPLLQASKRVIAFCSHSHWRMR